MDNIWYVILNYTDDPFVYKYTYLASVLCKRNYKQDKIKEFSNHLFILLKLFPNEDWDWNILSRNPAVTWDMIKLDYPWDCECVSSRPDLTEDIIKSIDIEWNWRMIYHNLNISEDFIKQKLNIELLSDIELNESYMKFYLNNFLWGDYTHTTYTNITWEEIKNNPTSFKNWDFISSCVGVTLEIIKNNPSKPWNWKEVSYNPNITCEIVQNNLDMPWDWECLSHNNNITWEFIAKHSDKNWNFDSLSYRTFGYKF